MFGATSVTAIPNAAAAANNPQSSSRFNSGSASGQSVTWTLAVFTALYLIWALVQKHEKLERQIEPSNIAFNLHNIVGVLLTVIVGGGLLKLLLAKAISWGFPGSDSAATVVEFAL